MPADPTSRPNRPRKRTSEQTSGSPSERTSAGSPSSASSFARSVQAKPDPGQRLQRGVELAVELVEGCDHAGVTLASRVAVETAAATDDLVRRGDALQYELSEGPCLDAVRQQHTVISPDLSVEVRWRSWAPRVHAELGVRAMMSLLLFTEDDSLGALNLYADRIDAWTPDSAAVATTLADQLAVALADAREIEHRGRAMVGRTIIGQAQGLLMERFDVDAEQAFAYLRRISQTQHQKLLAVAEDLIATRRLPDDGPDDGPGVSGVDPAARPHSDDEGRTAGNGSERRRQQ